MLSYSLIMSVQMSIPILPCICIKISYRIYPKYLDKGHEQVVLILYQMPQNASDESALSVASDLFSSF